MDAEMNLLKDTKLVNVLQGNEIVTFGVEGIEVKYPSNQEGDEKYFRDLAKKHNLFISAGSDCHGDSTHAPIGTSTLDLEEFMPLAERIGFKYGDSKCRICYLCGKKYWYSRT